MKTTPQPGVSVQRHRFGRALESIDAAIAQLDLRSDISGLKRLRVDVAAALRLARDPAR